MNSKEEVLKKGEEFISNKEFKEQTQECIECLLPNIGDTGVMPKLLTLSLDGENGGFKIDLFVINDNNFNDYDCRAGIIRKIGRECAEKRSHVCAVFLISEAWLSKQDGKKPRKYKQAEDDPNRKEIALIAGKTIGQHSSLTTAELSRDARKNISKIDEPQTKYDFERTGYFQSELIDGFWKCYLQLVAHRFMRER
jgi:hypothetical protein